MKIKKYTLKGHAQFLDLYGLDFLLTLFIFLSRTISNSIFILRVVPNVLIFFVPRKAYYLIFNLATVKASRNDSVRSANYNEPFMCYTNFIYYFHR